MQSEGCSESIERTSTYNCHLETWNPREIHEGEGLTGREEERAAMVGSQELRQDHPCNRKQKG